MALEQLPKDQPDDRQADRRHPEDGCHTEIVKHPAGTTDTNKLSEKNRRREERDCGAARLRRHLCGMGLQCVVQHVEAKADQEDRYDGEPPGWRKDHADKCQADK